MNNESELPLQKHLRLKGIGLEQLMVYARHKHNEWLDVVERGLIQSK